MRRLHCAAALAVWSLLGAACSGGSSITTGGSDGNAKPVANAGPSRGVQQNELVSLDGTRSKDPEGRRLSFSWTLVERPSGSNATLSGQDTSRPSLAPDVLGDYVLELVVSDGEKSSDPSTARVVADRGADHRVGPGRTLETPSAVAAIARDGEVITIDAWSYEGDVAVWRANNLTIHGIGGYAHIVGDGSTSAQGKGLWVVQGSNTTIENVEFSRAKVTDRNGAGIRAEGAGLTLRKCSFHDNENGILAANNAASSILIEHSSFRNNGYGDGKTHNLYVNRVDRLTILFSSFVGAKVGHQVKSRAKHTTLMYNRMLDLEEGNSSYGIDLPNGGLCVVVGNQVHQGPRALNTGLVAFAAEGAIHPTNELYFAHNTLVNERASGTFVRVWSGTAVLRNNLMVGAGTKLLGPGSSAGDVQTSDARFVDGSKFDFALTSSSPGVDQGVDPGFGGGLPLTPSFEFDASGQVRARTAVSTIDVGAFEFRPAQ